MSKNPVNKKDVKAVKALDGIYRKTLVYNENVMMCFFDLEKDSIIPLHNHKEHQIGYVIKGKIKFLTKDGSFIAETGDSYVFDSDEKHGGEIIEDSQVIDIFNPAREDYK